MTERALAGRRIIVLGARGGLGRSVVERLRADGALVIAAYSRPPADAERHDGERKLRDRDSGASRIARGHARHLTGDGAQHFRDSQALRSKFSYMLMKL